MVKMAVIQSGGKQYLVSENEELYVDRLSGNPSDRVELDALAVIDGDNIEIGQPALTKKVAATLIAQEKGEKVRVAKFKAKVRYRKANGFRQQLSKIKIDQIG